MDLAPANLPPWLLWSANAVFLPAVLWAARAAGPRLREVLSGQVVPACCVGVLVLWQIRVDVPPVPVVHLLGATFLTLLLGARQAVLAMTCILLATTLGGAGGWASLGLNGVLMCLLPVAVAALVLHLARRRLAPNPFVYILVGGFANAGLSLAVVGLVTGLVLAVATPLALEQVVHGYWTSYLLLLFPEAFLTGGMVAWLSMFYPEWMATYDGP